MLKSFEERVLIFTTSIENLYIFKVTNHKEDCRNNQSLKFTFEDVNKIQRNRYRIHRKVCSQKFPKKWSSKLLINDSNKSGNNQKSITFGNQINSLKFTFEDVNKIQRIRF